MNPVIVGLLGIVILLLLLFFEVHIGVAMGLVGLVGFMYLTSPEQGFSLLGMLAYSNMASYDLTVLPLFIAMGMLASSSGMAQELYDAAYKWVGSLRGGLAIATVATCAGFSAVSGTSVGTAATISPIALPQMKKYGYDDSLATGSVAAGGTLGILIPPSTLLIFYGILTETSVGALFIAGIVPGVLLSLLFVLVIYIVTKRNANLGPSGPKTTLEEKLGVLKNTWPTLTLFLVVIGGLYAGVFTATEAGGAGAFAALIIGIVRRRLGWRSLRSALLETMRTTAMIVFMLIGAFIFNVFLAISRLPVEISSILSELDVNRYVILLGIVGIYVICGCIMDMFAMLILTVPIFFPLMVTLGFDPVWFGVTVVIMMEQALITPPVGLNVFVIKGMAKDVPISKIFAGIIPFWLAMLVCVILLAVFPQIALFLGSS
jgi:tripartite ATP-independent transporter DctM subunit